ERCAANAVSAHKKQVILAGIAPIVPFGAVEDFLVRSYDADTGQLLWQDQTRVFTGLDNQAMAVDDEGKRAFIGGWVLKPGPSSLQAFLVRAYDMETGRLYWEDQYPGSVFRCYCEARDIAAHGKRVYAVGFAPFIVRAYDTKSGNLVWQNELPGRAESVV